MFKHLQIIVTVVVTLLLTACQKEKEETPTMQPAKKIVLTKSQQEIVGKNNSFAFDLFRALAGKHDESILCSPLSVESVLSMLLNGAEGDTYSQIVQALDYDGISLDDINSLYAAMKSGLAEADKTVVFSNANALWTNNFAPDANFSSALNTYYSAYLKELDFRSADAVKSINDWCTNNTNGKIKEVVDEINPDALMVIANALYFEGSWAEKFDASKTTVEDFHIPEGGTVEANMMHKTFDLKAAEIEEDKICFLPFGNGAYQMAVILPSIETDFAAFLEGFGIEKYRLMLGARQDYTVNLSVPRLSFESDISDYLINALRSLGIQDAFDGDAADFNELCKQHVYLNVFKQKSHLEMDEEGAKYAAVTHASGIDYAYIPPREMEFNANRPFVFLIYESSTGSILLIGSYTGR